MRTVKLEKDLVYFPTSMKDLYWLFSAHGIPVNLIKWKGKYSLIYVSDTMGAEQVNTPCRTIQDFSLKEWHDFAMKNLPAGYMLYDAGPYQLSIDKTMIRRVQTSTL